jgi:hypothetical protein
MWLNVKLNEELGVRIWSFPMRYQPTNLPDRSHVGEHWKRYQLRSLQIILQATHGVVSGDPEFFRRAFGGSVAEFEALLLRPHHFIFNRDWYEKHDGQGELQEYLGCAEQLDADDCRELLALLSSCDPRDFGKLPRQAQAPRVRDLLAFYQPLSKAEEARIWAVQKTYTSAVRPGPPEEELVEDAGLSADDENRETRARQSRRKWKSEPVMA